MGVIKTVKLELNQYLSPDDITKDPFPVMFTDEGRIRLKEDTTLDHDTFEIGVRLPDGTTRTWTMNKTSQMRVIKKYGDDTKAWVGKNVNIYKVSQNVLGKIKEVIYARDE